MTTYRQGIIPCQHSEHDGLVPGDTVRLIHSYGRTAVVTGVVDGEVMVCLRIGLSYQLRGPYTLDEIERVDPVSEAPS